MTLSTTATPGGTAPCPVVKYLVVFTDGRQAILTSCPICGHTFEKKTSREVAPTIQAPQNNQEQQHNDGPNCP